MNNVTVVIPTYRNPKCLNLCLHSAVRGKFLQQTEVIVIIDGFYEESKEVLEKYKGISVINLEQNQGMQYSQNIGVMNATTEYVFVINDDNILPDKWDVRSLAAMKELEQAQGDDKVVLTINQIEPSPSMFNFPVLDLGRMPETFQYDEFLKIEPTYSKDECTNDGQIYPFLIKKKWYLACGGFDTFYDSPNLCDWDWWLKLELLGFTFGRTHVLHSYHFGSISTKKNAESDKFRERERKAMETYQYKWGCSPYNKPGVNSKIPPDGQFRGFQYYE